MFLKEEIPMTRSIQSRVVLTLSVLLAAALGTAANAQSDAVRAIYLSAANVPTNIAGVNTYPDPPKGFNPLTASDEELASYGFPTRPDKLAEPDHYHMWERALGAAKIRWHGELKARSLPNSRPLAAPAHSPEAVLLTAAKASNAEASGVILNSGVSKWSSGSFADIWSVINVPVVSQPFANGSCTDGWYESMSLVGLDGYVFYSPATGHPLFEPGETTGVEEAFYCYNGGPTVYAAVFGWGTALNQAFALNPGDSFYTEIHGFGGCNSGSAFIEDLRTLTYNSYSIPNICLLPQTGRYANWVVWRPPFSNNGASLDGLNPLANTINLSFDGAEVLNLAGRPFYPGSQATTTWVVTMTDDSFSQSIELVNQGSGGYQGQHSLFFETTGCAYTGGCTP
jgi:hypothetical protein